MAESREHHQQHHPTENIKSLIQEKSPSATQALSVATLLPLGGILLALAGITLTGTVIGLAVATPLFVIFSPVLVPAAIVIGLAVTGFLVSGAFGLTGLTSLTWIAKPTSVLLPKNKTKAMAESREHHQQRHPTEIIKSLIQEKSPSATQALSVATLLPLGGILLALAGITLTGTLISLAVATPLFVIFSPVLVPAAIVIGLAVAGFLASGALGLTSLTWIANYLRGTRTKVPEQMDYIYMKRKMADAEGQVGQGIQNKAQG